MKRLFLFVTSGAVAAICLVVSCKKDASVPPLNEGYDYFPNNVGHYVIYNVDSLVLNGLQAQPVDTFKYQIKEVIDSIFADASGRPTQRIVRYKRTDPTKDWVIEKVWSGNLTTTDAERVEDNQRYVRLVFPLNANATWNGNVYNTQGTMNYQYISIDQSYSIGGTNFDSTLVVLQDSNLNLIQHQFYLERYARGVGRIYRDVIDLGFDSAGFDPSVEFWLNNPDIVVVEPLFARLAAGSVVYTETYVSSGN